MTSHLLGALIALGLVAVNALFVVVEISLVRVRASRLELLARRGDLRAGLVQGMVQSLDVYLSAIQMGITMTSLGLGWVGEPAVAALLGGALGRLPLAPVITHGLSFAAAFGLITFLHILLGELVPRAVGIRKAEAVALAAAPALRLFHVAFRLPTALLAASAQRVLRLLRLGPGADAGAHLSEEEMRVILGSAEEKAGFSLERLMLIENIFDFGQSKVADAMIPKERVACLRLNGSWEENLETVRSRRFSRYPLCADGLDSASGFVHVKDLLLSGGLPPDLLRLRRELTQVSPGDSLQKLLQGFADKGVHLALVRGGDGAAAGIITLEDILEEIVGEVHDEFDLPQAWSLMDVLVPSAVSLELDHADRASCLRQLVSRLRAAHPALDAEEAMRVVWERESRFSSAVGRGAAIPHGRLPGLERPLVAAGLSAKPLPFPAPDKAPVRLVFLVLTPAAAPLLQLKILARLASLLSNENLRRRLLRARTAEQLLDILRTADTVLAN